LKTGRPSGVRQENDAQVRATVEQMLLAIEARGESAVRQYSTQLDKWSPASFRLSEAEINACINALPAQTLDDIRYAQTQIRRFAQFKTACGECPQRRHSYAYARALLQPLAA
jgi:sulfopropanediol 3-dehydrogenase